MRVYITTRTVGQAFGTIGQLRQFCPGHPDHGAIVAETGARPLGFTSAAMNAAVDLATTRGLTVVDEDYQP